MTIWLTLETMPDWLAWAARRVWDDLQQDGPLPRLMPVAETDDPDLPGAYWLGLGRHGTAGHGQISGGPVWAASPFAQTLVTVAENMQNVVSEMPGARAQARPRCPYHPHPMKPVVLDDQAWWTCGVLNQQLARIAEGQLIPGRAWPVPHSQP